MVGPTMWRETGVFEIIRELNKMVNVHLMTLVMTNHISMAHRPTHHSHAGFPPVFRLSVSAICALDREFGQTSEKFQVERCYPPGLTAYIPFVQKIEEMIEYH